MRCLPILALCISAVPALAFEGKYSGGAPGYQQSLSIESGGGNHYRIHATVSAAGCRGDVIATGTSNEKLLTATAQTPEGQVCTITLLRAGPNLQLDQRQCRSFSGPNCDFSGTYSRH